MSIRGSFFKAAAFALGLTAAVTGCEDKKATKPPEGPDGGAAHGSSRADKNIVEALRAEGSAQASSGPPETGVFPPGAADKELKVGDPPKLVVGAKGSEPFVTLVPPAAKPAKKLAGKIGIAVQTGPRSAMPTVELGITTEIAEKPADAPAGPTVIDVKTVVARLADNQPGQLPPGADKTVGKARGSRFTLEVDPTGSGHVTRVEPSKELDPALGLVVQAAADTMTFAYQPYPKDPVGAGGFWMVTTREPYAGTDCMVYRMYKVAEVKPDRVMLEVQVKRLVASGQLGLPGIPAHAINEFNDNTTGHLEVMAADTSQVHAELSDTMLAAMTPAGAPPGQPPGGPGPQGNQMQVQILVKSRLALGR